MYNAKKLTIFVFSLLILGLMPALLSAQDNMSNSGQSMSATGCLKQGTDAHGFYMMGDDGKMYELWGKGLSDHVGHKITVTGSQATKPEGIEKKKEASEKQESGGATVVDLKVSDIKMVSESCQ